MTEILAALDTAPFTPGKPSVIVAHTTKAKGISFAEDTLAYHYWKPAEGELEQAITELDAKIAECEQKVTR